MSGAFLARAGGGHGFGGGGSGSSSGGGGGHSFFFFGGGGGGSGAVSGIVILAIAAFILFIIMFSLRRRRRVVADGGGAPPSPLSGGWSHDDQPAINSVRGDLFPGSTPAAGPLSSADGLAQITAHDPGFSTEVFLEQAQRAFFIVQEAWTERKPDISRRVMADGLWQQHRVQIGGYVNAHKRNVLEDLSVGNATIIAAHSEGSYDTVVVRFWAACADYDVNDEGKVIRGDRRVNQWQEDWTFQRSSSATTKADGGTLSSKCPNCGAPLDLDLAGVCSYCKAPVMSGAYDWVLARISQLPG